MACVVRKVVRNVVQKIAPTDFPEGHKKRVVWRWIFLLACCLVAGACSTIPVEERDVLRQRVDTRAEEALQAFLNDDPSVREKIEAAAGYLVGGRDMLLVGVLGKTSGVGVLHDNRDNTKTYLDISSAALGVGVGSSDVQFLAIINSREALNKLQKGTWTINPGARLGAGSVSQSAQLSTENVELHTRGKSGALVGAELEVVHVEVNTNLTDTGLATFGIPGINSERGYDQNNPAPRKWQYPLPFMAQQVVDLGYDLPRPFGVGVAYVDMSQEMSLTGLSVGFNDIAPTPYNWVSFDNAVTDFVTTQIMLDAWILPFMNVFALYGKVDGNINMDVSLDGDQLLVDSGTDCSVPVIRRPPACFILPGRVVTFPIRAPVRPETWGLGTVLAGAWHNWFVALPFNVTWSDGDDVDIEGKSFTFTPRGGYIFSLGNMGRLGVFAGGNYLDSENTAEGEAYLPDVGIPLNVSLAFQIDQKNLDRWNTVLGFNWDITPGLSLRAEYDGFTGSREGFISSLVVRF